MEGLILYAHKCLALGQRAEDLFTSLFAKQSRLWQGDGLPLATQNTTVEEEMTFMTTQKIVTETPEKTQQYVKSSDPRSDSATSFQEGLHSIARLQRILGNRYVTRLIHAKRLTPEGKIIGLQRKLTVGAADDQYEQEADLVARQVMRIPDAVVANSMQRAMTPVEDKDKMLQTKPLASSITPFVQREMTNNEDPDDKEKPVQARFLTEMNNQSLQRQPDAEEEEKESIQAKAAGPLADSFEADDNVETQVSQSKGRGARYRTLYEPTWSPGLA